MQNTKINDLIAVTEFENIIKKRDMYLFYENMFEYIGQSDMFSKHSHELEKYAKTIRREFNNINKLLLRIYSTWQSEDFPNTRLEKITIFINLDIEAILVKYKVIIDALAEIIKLSFPEKLKINKKKSTIYDCFNHLKSLNNSTDLLQVSWYLDINSYRNSIIHRGSSCMTFNIDEEITFQIFDENLDPLIIDEEYMMADKKTIIFSHFLVVYVSYLFKFISEVFKAMLIEKTKNISNSEYLKSKDFVLSRMNIGSSMSSDEELLYLELIRKFKISLI